MASIRWAGASKKVAIVTQSDGTELTLQSEWSDPNSGAITSGDCITVSRTNPNDPAHIGKVVGFRFTSGGQPTSIFWHRWRGTEWGGQNEMTSDQFDGINKVDCPPGSTSVSGAARTRKTRSRKSRSRKSRNRSRRN